MARPVALVSCDEARHHDHDLDPIIRALGDRGRIAQVVNWDDSSQDWSGFDAVIVRSPWDYHHRYDEFLQWVNNVSTQTQLLNCEEILTWNTNKVYLGEMIEAGIAVIPTTFVASAEEMVQVNDQLSGDVVVKPTVSAGSNNTKRHMHQSVEAAAHVLSLLDSGKVAMVQPYQRFIDERGETGMLYFNGEFSHAFRKGAILSDGEGAMNGLFVEEDIRTRQPSGQERELGDDVMSFIFNKFGYYPLYARVDVVRGSAGVPVLMELELAEPSLYLHTGSDAASRFASAVLARL
jgi:hypothetical protein